MGQILRRPLIPDNHFSFVAVVTGADQRPIVDRKSPDAVERDGRALPNDLTI